MRLTSRQLRLAGKAVKHATKPAAAVAVAGYRLSIFLLELSQDFARAEEEMNDARR